MPLGCLQENVGKVLEGQAGEVPSRNGDLEQLHCQSLAQHWSHSGGDGGDGTPEPATAMLEQSGRSWQHQRW